MELNKYDVNANIKPGLLSPKEMINIGFSFLWDVLAGNMWVYCKYFDDSTSFGVTIYEKDMDNVDIHVTDEDFGQHYDYQHILDKHPECRYALDVKCFVEKQMKYLQEAGVLRGHEYGEYI